MPYRLDDLLTTRLDEAAREFDERGFVLLEGVGDDITPHFRALVGAALELDGDALDRTLDADAPPEMLASESRRRMSRITTPPALKRTLTTALRPWLARLLGPFCHVSTSFHGQFKSGEAPPVDHGGYPGETKFLEVQGQYLLHQDFTGAAIPTSPCAITLWVPLNTCSDWNLRLYPGAHRRGLICNRWLQLDDPRLAPLGKPVDVEAKLGNAVIFNSLVLHSSSNPGPGRRVSCDIRFFPFCGFLPSEVYPLADAPLDFLRQRLESEQLETLRAPLLETAAFLGIDAPRPDPAPCSILNWAHYVQGLLDEGAETALPRMARFVNDELGIDTLDAYAGKFHARPVHMSALRSARKSISELEPGVAELARLDRRLAELAPNGG